MKNQNSEKNQKKMEEAELMVIKLDEDVIITSGEGDCCFAPGTKITMADGTLKNIEDVKLRESVLTFDHESGEHINRDVICVFKSDEKRCGFTLNFADGTNITLINAHDLLEQESMKYICISKQNAESFIGKHFYNAVKNVFVELLNVTYEISEMYYYTLYTAKSMNYIANGMLNVSDDMGYMLNIYELDEYLKADAKILAYDIEKYGLYERSDIDGLTEQEYREWNSQYLNIAVGKGLTTWDKLEEQRIKYLDLLNGKNS